MKEQNLCRCLVPAQDAAGAPCLHVWDQLHQMQNDVERITALAVDMATIATLVDYTARQSGNLSNGSETNTLHGIKAPTADEMRTLEAWVFQTACNVAESCRHVQQSLGEIAQATQTPQAKAEMNGTERGEVARALEDVLAAIYRTEAQLRGTLASLPPSADT